MLKITQAPRAIFPVGRIPHLPREAYPDDRNKTLKADRTRGQWRSVARWVLANFRPWTTRMDNGLTRPEDRFYTDPMGLLVAFVEELERTEYGRHILRFIERCINNQRIGNIAKVVSRAYRARAVVPWNDKTTLDACRPTSTEEQAEQDRAVEEQTETKTPLDEKTIEQEMARDAQAQEMVDLIDSEAEERHDAMLQHLTTLQQAYIDQKSPVLLPADQRDCLGQMDRRIISQIQKKFQAMQDRPIEFIDRHPVPQAQPRDLGMVGAVMTPDRLTPQQKAVVDRVYNAVKGYETKDRLFLVEGGPGTGKTAMIRALVERLQQEQIAVMCTAPTGIAASQLPHGKTIHSVFQLLMSDARLSHDAAGRIQRMLQGVKLLVIDEMSMLSAYYLGMIHERMRKALHADHQEFGGIPVLLVGDFNQLKPVQGLALYQAALSHAGIEKQARLGKSPIALQGARLFAKFVRLELTQQLRAIDPLQQQRINSLLQPDAEISPKLLRDLRDAQLQAEDITQDPDWIFGPFIVSLNSQRMAYTKELAKFAGRYRLDNVVLEWSLPLVGQSPENLYENVRALHEKAPQCQGLFLKGAGAFIEENICPSRGLANGSYCTLETVVFNKPADYEHAQRLIANKLARTLIQIWAGG